MKGITSFGSMSVIAVLLKGLFGLKIQSLKNDKCDGLQEISFGFLEMS